MRPDKKKNKGRKKPHETGSTSAQTQNTLQVDGEDVANEQDQKAKDSDLIAPHDQINHEGHSEQSNTGESEEVAVNKIKRYSKRTIISCEQQWAQYEEPERAGAEEEEEHQGLDFEELLKVPVSAEGHFFFKSEKLEVPSSGNLFALNLEALSEGLKSIPFYKQLELPTFYFSAAEIEAMDQKAAIHNVSLHSKIAFQDEPSHFPPVIVKSVKLTKLKADTTQDSEVNDSKEVSEVLSPMIKQIRLSGSDLGEESLTPISKVTPVTCIETCSTPVMARACSPNLSLDNNSPALPDPSLTQVLPVTPKAQREKIPNKSKPIIPVHQNKTCEQNKIENAPTVNDNQFLDSVSDTIDKDSEVIKPTTTAVNPAVPSDDLEAWLDSVLDD